MRSAMSKPDSRIVVSEAARVCFAIAGCALFAAIMGAVVSSYLSGWMCVLGMITIALLYLGLGVSQLRLEEPINAEAPEAETSFEPHSSTATERSESPAPRDPQRSAARSNSTTPR